MDISLRATELPEPQDHGLVGLSWNDIFPPPPGRRTGDAGLDAKFERAAFATTAAAVGKGTERQRLDGLAEQRFAGDKDLARFREHMKVFEERARSRGVADDEVARTYAEISRLLEVDGDQFLSKRARIIAAQQVMRNAAEPTLIDNGYHKTCNVASVEARTYTMYPAAAAKLVADVATTGEYRSADGTVIKIDPGSLRPDDEASGNPPRDGQRSYASQIFQVTAVNVFWQRQTRDPQGNVVPRGSIRYEQMPVRMKPDTGERLVSYAQGKRADVKDRKNNVIRQPHLRTNDVVEVSNQITGRAESDVLVENTNKPDNGYRTLDAGSEQELRNLLVDLKQKGRLPVIIAIHTGNEPFKSDSRLTTSSAGVWHVLTVTDIDPASGKVSVDNQWGTRADHAGRKAIDVSSLYKATLEPGAHKKNELIPRRTNEPVIVGEAVHIVPARSDHE